MLENSMNDKLVECYNVQRQVQLRYLCLDDLLEVKQLCSEWFPIEYPESWYNDILTDSRFYSLAATFNLKIIGMIVCEVKPRSRCNREDYDVLASNYPTSTLVAYILSLGVVKQFRRKGIASLLLDNLLSYLTSSDMDACKAVYLHVLTTNSVAIQFYEQRSFHIHACLPYYYSIKGKLHDGFSYVLYINGGKPPSTLILLIVANTSPIFCPRCNLVLYHFTCSKWSEDSGVMSVEQILLLLKVLMTTKETADHLKEITGCCSTFKALLEE